MCRNLLLIFLLISLTACASSPLSMLSDALGKGGTLPLGMAFEADAQATIAWVDSAEGPTNELDKFTAKICPNAIILARADNKADLEKIRTLLMSVDTRAKDLAGGSTPMMILTLTKYKYGSAANDPMADIDYLKTRILNRYTTLRNSCANILPEKQMIQLAEKYFGM